MASSASLALTLTCLAWFAHRLISWWRDQRSRGRAEISDVLGWESSLREAQVNALKTLLQVVVWVLYTCAMLWTAGIGVERLLLFPSITALLIGWVGREVMANVISGVVLHVTQPFAQGDWVTLETGAIDGWVQDVGTFYTRVCQWDKRPIYVPNFKLMSMNVQNNSRMTHRRVIFDLPLRLKDIPTIPKIVQEIQEMVNEHEDVDTVQHRLVRWRTIGQYAAEIWVSCYTRPNLEGIRLGTWTAVQQSILERCAAIVYKNGAQFASITDRQGYGQDGGDPKEMRFDNLITEKLFEAWNSSRELQLQSREQVLRQREKDVKEREREVESEAADVSSASEKYRKLLAQAVLRQEAERVASEEDGNAPTSPPTLEGDSFFVKEASGSVEDTSVDDAALQADVDDRFPDIHTTMAAADAELVAVAVAKASRDEAKAPSRKVVDEDSPAVRTSDVDMLGVGVDAAEDLDPLAVAVMHPEEAGDLEPAETSRPPVHEGEVLHQKKAEKTRIPVKEMGD